MKTEFDVVRDLMQGAIEEQEPPRSRRVRVRPASFREIDARELARQYVEHRKIVDGTVLPVEIARRMRPPADSKMTSSPAPVLPILKAESRETLARGQRGSRIWDFVQRLRSRNGGSDAPDAEEPAP